MTGELLLMYGRPGKWQHESPCGSSADWETWKKNKAGSSNVQDEYEERHWHLVKMSHWTVMISSGLENQDILFTMWKWIFFFFYLFLVFSTFSPCAPCSPRLFAVQLTTSLLLWQVKPLASWLRNPKRNLVKAFCKVANPQSWRQWKSLERNIQSTQVDSSLKRIIL